MKNTKKQVRRDYTQKLTEEFNPEYVEEIFNMLSILHDMKHAGTLPKEIEQYRGIIESFSPGKLGIEETYS